MQVNTQTNAATVAAAAPTAVAVAQRHPAISEPMPGCKLFQTLWQVACSHAAQCSHTHTTQPLLCGGVCEVGSWGVVQGSALPIETKKWLSGSACLKRETEIVAHEFIITIYDVRLLCATFCEQSAAMLCKCIVNDLARCVWRHCNAYKAVTGAECYSPRPWVYGYLYISV